MTGLGAAACGLQGCAGPVATDIRSAGAGMRGDMALMWAAGPEGGAQNRVLRDSVEKALQARGYRFAEEAPAVVSIGYAQRPAAIALTTGKGEALSPAKEPRLLQNCEDRTMRLTVAIVARESGDRLYSGAAQEAHCHAGAQEVMGRLVDHALADMDTPGGARRVFSMARD